MYILHIYFLIILIVRDHIKYINICTNYGIHLYVVTSYKIFIILS